MSAQEWVNLQEGLLVVFGPVFVSALPLVVVASLLATVIGGVMYATHRLRQS